MTEEQTLQANTQTEDAAPATPADTAIQPDSKNETEKWKALSRKHEAQAKENAAAARKLAAIEESQKTETQKAADREAAEKARADAAEFKALRYEVGIEKSVPVNLLRYLTGSTKEEVEANAAQLLADFGIGSDQRDGTHQVRPREALRPGASAATTTTDPHQAINDGIRQAAGRRT